MAPLETEVLSFFKNLRCGEHRLERIPYLSKWLFTCRGRALVSTRGIPYHQAMAKKKSIKFREKHAKLLPSLPRFFCWPY